MLFNCGGWGAKEREAGDYTPRNHPRLLIGSHVDGTRRARNLTLGALNWFNIQSACRIQDMGWFRVAKWLQSLNGVERCNVQTLWFLEQEMLA